MQIVITSCIGRGSFSLFESGKDLFGNTCNFFLVGFRCRRSYQFFPTLRWCFSSIVIDHSPPLPGTLQPTTLPGDVAGVCVPTDTMFSAKEIARRIDSGEASMLHTSEGGWFSNKNHFLGRSGESEVLAVSFSSNPFSVPSE